MAKKEEGRKFITSLARDIDILNQSMQSPIERFGELGSSGNKAWTLFARAASGSFWWRLQARLRVFSNAAELFTDRQKAQNKALLELIENPCCWLLNEPDILICPLIVCDTAVMNPGNVSLIADAAVIPESFSELLNTYFKLSVSVASYLS